MNDRILTNREVIEFLKQQTIFEGITEEEIAYLVDVTSQTQYQSGETIFVEGDASNDLYFIYEGKVDIVKKDPEKETELALGTLHSKDFFGDMSFIDDAVRSSTVKATVPTIVLKVPKERTYSQSSELTNICNKMIRNLSKVNIRRLRETNERFSEQMEGKFLGLETRQNVGKVVGAAGLLLVIMGSAVYHAIPALKAHPIFQFWIAPIIPLSFIIPLIPRLGLSYSIFGLTFEGWRKSLREALWISLVLIMIFAIRFGVSAWMTGTYYPIGKAQFSNSVGILFSLTFPFYIFMAQLLDRGILQGGINYFLANKSGISGIFINSLFQFALYLSVDVGAAIYVFVEACFLGWIYNRHKTLLGVCVVALVEGYLLQIYPLF